MSFKGFIYYCALSGGWAAFIVWALVHTLAIAGRAATMNPLLSVPLTGGILGLFIGAAVGAMDALLNAVGFQRVPRVLLCMTIGMVGGVLSSLLGQLLHQFLWVPVVVGWMLTGMCIGASIGMYDWLQALRANEDASIPFKKVANGIIGGLLGGLIGGLPYEYFRDISALSRSGLTISLVCLGTSIGLMIGLAQVVLKEAWLKIEAGFRVGREVMLSKEVTTIGRAETCDIGLFRDNTIERFHARILLRNHRYVLEDQESAAGTYLNNQRLGKPAGLKNGDLIRVGNCELRFGERQKRTSH